MSARPRLTSTRGPGPELDPTASSLRTGGVVGPDAVLGLPLCITNYPIMPTGKVKFFNEEKGFGFITNEENNQDVFVHVSGLVHEIRQNDRVSFEVQEGRKGPNAVNVTRLQ